MTAYEIKNFVMFQTGNDTADVGDFAPYLLDYINEGYDRLVYAYAREHVGSTTYPTLADDADEPNLPVWTHLGIANWATWCVYRSGNPQKQSRGFAFRAAAEETASGIRTGSASRQFVNVPR